MTANNPEGGVIVVPPERAKEFGDALIAHARTQESLVEGVIHLDDGETVSFRISRELGYSQWGNTAAALGRSQPIVEALASGLVDAEIDFSEPPEPAP